MERISVIIPNWNGKRFLDTCLSSLQRQTYRDFVTYLVDNGSSDDSIEHVELNYPEVRVIRHNKNLGFSAAINAGIRASTGEYIAALNNDTEVDQGWLEALVTTFETRLDIGLCASKVLDFSDRKVIDSYGDGYSRYCIAFKIGSLSQDGEMFETPLEVLSPCAAASAYRRSVFDDIGMLDEDFFCYMEDIDFGLRAALAGYLCLVVPTAKVYHIGSASTGGGMSEFSLRMTAKNVPHVICKNIPSSLLWKVIPMMLAGQTFLVIETLIGLRPEIRKNFSSYWMGLATAIRELPLMLKKRQQIQSMQKISSKSFYDLIKRSELQRRAFRVPR